MAKERLAEDARVAIYLAGVGYATLWGVAWWLLGPGMDVLATASGCRLAVLPTLFGWVCTADAELRLAADLFNGVLGSTVWAPAVVAAAVDAPSGRLVAAGVVTLHLIGLPAALLFAIRVGERCCDRLARRAPAPAAAKASAPTFDPEALIARALRRPARVPVPPRATFGLRRRAWEATAGDDTPLDRLRRFGLARGSGQATADVR